MNYYIADTHFGHKNVLKLCNRPFTDVEQMNQALIENWNCKVNVSDHIYILGDMFFRCEEPQEILKQLKGKKHLILGNHDSWVKNAEIEKYFVSIDSFLEFSDGKRSLVLCHYPMLSFRHEKRKNAFMIHGHIHNDTDIDIFPLLQKRENVLNAGVDINGFMPVSFEELIDNNRRFKQENAKDILLNDIMFIAEHKKSGKRIEFNILKNTDGDEYAVHINGKYYEQTNTVDDIFLDSADDSEYIFRLKRPNESEEGLVKPLKIISAKAKSDYKMEILFSNKKIYEFDLKERLKQRVIEQDDLDFEDFEATDCYIHWNNTLIYMTLLQFLFDITHNLAVEIGKDNNK